MVYSLPRYIPGWYIASLGTYPEGIYGATLTYPGGVYGHPLHTRVVYSFLACYPGGV